MTFREELMKLTCRNQNTNYDILRDTFKNTCREYALCGKYEFSMSVAGNIGLYFEHFAAELGLEYFRKGDKCGVRWKCRGSSGFLRFWAKMKNRKGNSSLNEILIEIIKFCERLK